MYRYYFEVEIFGVGIYIGLIYKGIDRKGEERNSCIFGNNFFWSFYWNGKEFIVWYSDTEISFKVGFFRRLGVYVDFSGGIFFFYGVEFDVMILVYKFDCKFSESVYFVFWFFKKENFIWIVDLGEEFEKLALILAEVVF